MSRVGGAGTRASRQGPQPAVFHPHPSASLCSPAHLPAIRAPGTPHPAEDLPHRPSCLALPEPSISLQPQKSWARDLGLKVQAVEKTVTSKERMVTETARALQATAQAMLHKTQPLTQVGSCAWRQVPGGGWGCLRGDLGSGLQGREEQRPEVPPPNFQSTSVSQVRSSCCPGKQKCERRRGGQTDRRRTSSTQAHAHQSSALLTMGMGLIHSFFHSLVHSPNI